MNDFRRRRSGLRCEAVVGAGSIAHDAAAHGGTRSRRRVSLVCRWTWRARNLPHPLRCGRDFVGKARLLGHAAVAGFIFSLGLRRRGWTWRVFGRCEFGRWRRHFLQLFVQLVHETAEELLRVVLLIASEHRVNRADAADDFVGNDVAAALVEPEFLDETVVAFREADLRPCCIALHDGAAFKEEASQWWRVAERLQCAVHVASIGNVFQSHKSIELSLMVVILFVIVTSAERRSTTFPSAAAVEILLMEVKNSSIFVGVKRARALMEAIGLIMNEDFALAEIAPDTLR